jgi:hypothetical protein
MHTELRERQAKMGRYYNKIGNVHMNITLRRVRVTIVAVKKPEVLNILCACP